MTKMGQFTLFLFLVCINSSPFSASTYFASFLILHSSSQRKKIAQSGDWQALNYRTQEGLLKMMKTFAENEELLQKLSFVSSFAFIFNLEPI